MRSTHPRSLRLADHRLRPSRIVDLATGSQRVPPTRREGSLIRHQPNRIAGLSVGRGTVGDIAARQRRLHRAILPCLVRARRQAWNGCARPDASSSDHLRPSLFLGGSPTQRCSYLHHRSNPRWSEGAKRRPAAIGTNSPCEGGGQNVRSWGETDRAEATVCTVKVDPEQTSALQAVNRLESTHGSGQHAL